MLGTHLKSIADVYSDCCITAPSYVSTRQALSSFPFSPLNRPINVGTQRPCRGASLPR